MFFCWQSLYIHFLCVLCSWTGRFDCDWFTHSFDHIHHTNNELKGDMGWKSVCIYHNVHSVRFPVEETFTINDEYFRNAPVGELNERFLSEILNYFSHWLYRSRCIHTFPFAIRFLPIYPHCICLFVQTLFD